MDSTDSNAALEIIVRGARALARGEAPGPTLEALLGVIAEQLDVESAVVVVGDGPDRLRIVASTGLPEAAVAGLAEALRNPRHPIARTVQERVSSFDVLPSVPGGPALRSHLPLTITRDGAETVIGVLALAHHRPMDAKSRVLLDAAADLAAAALKQGEVT